jgi:hypothetical protein
VEIEESRGRVEDKSQIEEQYYVTGMDLGTCNDVVVDDNDDNFRIQCVTAGTNTETTAIVRISVFECHEILLHMPPERRCCSTASDICCLSVEALQNYTIRLNGTAIRQGIEDPERTELFVIQTIA